MSSLYSIYRNVTVHCMEETNLYDIEFLKKYSYGDLLYGLVTETRGTNQHGIGFVRLWAYKYIAIFDKMNQARREHLIEGLLDNSEEYIKYAYSDGIIDIPEIITLHAILDSVYEKFKSPDSLVEKDELCEIRNALLMILKCGLVEFKTWRDNLLSVNTENLTEDEYESGEEEIQKTLDDDLSEFKSPMNILTPLFDKLQPIMGLLICLSNKITKEVIDGNGNTEG